MEIDNLVGPSIKACFYLGRSQKEKANTKETHMVSKTFIRTSKHTQKMEHS
jgi:hypothetical protein